MSSVQQDTPQMAEKYDIVSDRQYGNGAELVDGLGIGEGDSVLDLGCGTGRLAFYVARKVGPSGRVLGIDPAPLRIDIAKKKLASEGLSNVEFRVAGSEDLRDFAPGQFDAVYLSAVFHWIVDKDAAAAQILRVLKPGGRIGITTLDVEHLPTVDQITRELAARAPYAGNVDPDDEKMKLVNRDELERILKVAGFRDVSVEIRHRSSFWATPAEAVEFIEASSFGNFLQHVPRRIRGSFRRDLEAELAKRSTARGIEHNPNMIYAIGTRP